MRKLFALIAVLGMLTIGASSMLMAQENETTQTETTETYQEEEETTDPTVLELQCMQRSNRNSSKVVPDLWLVLYCV